MPAPNLYLLEMTDFVTAYVGVLLNTIKDNILEGPCRLYGIVSQGDSGAVDFLKLYDDINPVAGTADPDYSFPVVSNVWTPVFFDPDGLTFDNGLSLLADDAGGTTIGSAATALNVLLLLRRGAS